MEIFSHFHDMSFTRACGYKFQNYTDQDMSSLSDPFLAYTAMLLLLFRKSKITL